MTQPAVKVSELTFSWSAVQPPILQIPSFDIAAGEKLFLRGPSGSGKSSLLGLIAGVLPPKGTIEVLGQNIGALTGAGRDRFRADHMGVVFQLFNLVPYLSVGENVALPVQFSKRRRTQVEGDLDTEISRLLTSLGLEGDNLMKRTARDLSVGQQQRVAAARALIGRPELIICDEPTSALDADTRDRFISLLAAEVERHGTTLIFVSHDMSLASHFDRSVDLAEINIASETYAGAA